MFAIPLTYLVRAAYGRPRHACTPASLLHLGRYGASVCLQHSIAGRRPAHIEHQKLELRSIFARCIWHIDTAKIW